MARREKRKETMIREVVKVMEQEILAMEIGSGDRLGRMVTNYYTQRGYQKKHLGIHIGDALTKDGGETYLLKDTDLFEVLEQLSGKLKGKRILDFSAYDNMFVGLPYNLVFVVREDDSTDSNE